MNKAPKSVRLSTDVVPRRYRVMVKPDFDTFTFAGEVHIELELKKAVHEITLHAKELQVFTALAQTKQASLKARKISYNKAAETVTLAFSEQLTKGSLTLQITYQGSLNDKMRGFYRSSFEHEGKTKWLAVTQFESTDARCALPCVDEPAMKAIFEVTLVVPREMEAISNTLPEAISENGAHKIVRFSPTPPMSTYLLTFLIGEFEYIEKKSKDGVLVRVFTTPGKKDQARFALECGAKTIDFFNEYFAIPYPLPVLDMIAIPDFAAGAMENWGAVTYRETALLVDPKNSSTMNKQWVAIVVAHELAHQWFGNLVTMEWWTHLWLNEGFASYIEYLAVNKLFPSWDMWTQFLYHDMRPAFHLDSLKHTHPIEVEVHHPSEIAAVFDAVSYSKGASVIRMLAEYLGEKHFRDGLRYYLKKHSYGNTVTEDLWRALAKVSGKPVEKMMKNWTGAGGYPLLTVSERSKDLAIEQSRFFSSPLSAKGSKDNTVWQVPISLVTDRGRTNGSTLMTGKKARIKKPRSAWLKLNADESAFYRTMYSPELREPLAAAARTKKLATRDRLGLIRDIFALAESGSVSAAEALAFASNYQKETAYVAWAEIASSIATMHSLIALEPFREQFEKASLGFLTEIGKKYSWQTKPKDHSDALLKVLILGALGRFGDKKTVTHAQKLLTAAKNSVDHIPADLRGVVYAINARFGGKKEYDALMRLYEKVPLQEEKTRLMLALAGFRDKALLAKTLDFARSDAVRLQDKTRVIGSVMVNPAGTELGWKYVQKYWKHFQERYSGGRELAHLIDPMRVSTNPKHAEEIEKFFKKHPTPGTERAIKQTCEQIRANALWLKRNRASLAEYLNHA